MSLSYFTLSPTITLRIACWAWQEAVPAGVQMQLEPLPASSPAHSESHTFASIACGTVKPKQKLSWELKKKQIEDLKLKFTWESI